MVKWVVVLLAAVVTATPLRSNYNAASLPPLDYQLKAVKNVLCQGLGTGDCGEEIPSWAEAEQAKKEEEAKKVEEVLKEQAKIADAARAEIARQQERQEYEQQKREMEAAREAWRYGDDGNVLPGRVYHHPLPRFQQNEGSEIRTGAAPGSPHLNSRIPAYYPRGYGDLPPPSVSPKPYPSVEPIRTHLWITSQNRFPHQREKYHRFVSITPTPYPTPTPTPTRVPTETAVPTTTESIVATTVSSSTTTSVSNNTTGTNSTSTVKTSNTTTTGTNTTATANNTTSTTANNTTATSNTTAISTSNSTTTSTNSTASATPSPTATTTIRKATFMLVAGAPKEAPTEDVQAMDLMQFLLGDGGKTVDIPKPLPVKSLPIGNVINYQGFILTKSLTNPFSEALDFFSQPRKSLCTHRFSHRCVDAPEYSPSQSPIPSPSRVAVPTPSPSPSVTPSRATQKALADAAAAAATAARHLAFIQKHPILHRHHFDENPVQQQDVPQLQASTPSSFEEPLHFDEAFDSPPQQISSPYGVGQAFAVPADADDSSVDVIQSA